MRFSEITRRIAGEGSDAWLVHDRAVVRQSRGEDIILLSIGDPDFDTPAPIRDAAVAALGRGRTHYSPIGGEPALREAIAAVTAPTVGRSIDPEQVVVFPGAQAALFALAQCLFDPGDEVITPEPTYVTYEALFRAPGASMRQIPLRPERAFQLDPDDVARAVTPRTRGLALNFPHNPTGATLEKAEALAIERICERNDLVLISDEVYGSLTFDRPYESPAALPSLADRTVIVSSLSKSHAMTGWRCGWAVAPLELARHLGEIARCMYFGVAQFVQDAAAEALAHRGAELSVIRQAYAERARVLGPRLAAIPGIACRVPTAGMYLFADVRATGLDGKEFAIRLLDATGVSVTPGEGFGPSGAGHVRITLGTGLDRLREAADRIERFVASLRPAEAGSRAQAAATT
jgi:arginine:pyruvate transaminase